MITLKPNCCREAVLQRSVLHKQYPPLTRNESMLQPSDSGSKVLQLYSYADTPDPEEKKDIFLGSFV